VELWGMVPVLTNRGSESGNMIENVDGPIQCPHKSRRTPPAPVPTLDGSAGPPNYAP
jgi:hypothetical protein